MTLKLTQRVISKKNSRQLVWAGNKRISLPSKAYEQFKQFSLLELRTQHPSHMTGPVRVHCNFYIKGAYKVDGDNMLTSIFDILQDAGIIDDDVMIMAGSFEKHPGAGGWGTHISIEPYCGGKKCLTTMSHQVD